MTVLGEGLTDHVANLELTFERFRQHYLKLQPKKYSLFNAKITLLGHFWLVWHCRESRQHYQSKELANPTVCEGCREIPRICELSS